MSEPFVGQIKMFAGNFAPRGYSFCDGQLLAVSQNDALFSLLGTIYGGDGETTFGLPDLRGRIPIHGNEGPGLTPRNLGQRSGQEKVTLTANQLPSHAHTAQGTTAAASSNNPNGTLPAVANENTYFAGSAVNMSSLAVKNTGGSQSHTNLQPALAVNFIISLSGIYPSRS